MSEFVLAVLAVTAIQCSNAGALPIDNLILPDLSTTAGKAYVQPISYSVQPAASFQTSISANPFAAFAQGATTLLTAPLAAVFSAAPLATAPLGAAHLAAQYTSAQWAGHLAGAPLRANNFASSLINTAAALPGAALKVASLPLDSVSPLITASTGGAASVPLSLAAIPNKLFEGRVEAVTLPPAGSANEA